MRSGVEIFVSLSISALQEQCSIPRFSDRSHKYHCWYPQNKPPTCPSTKAPTLKLARDGNHRQKHPLKPFLNLPKLRLLLRRRRRSDRLLETPLVWQPHELKLQKLAALARPRLLVLLHHPVQAVVADPYQRSILVVTRALSTENAHGRSHPSRLLQTLGARARLEDRVAVVLVSAVVAAVQDGLAVVAVEVRIFWVLRDDDGPGPAVRASGDALDLGAVGAVEECDVDKRPPVAGGETVVAEYLGVALLRDVARIEPVASSDVASLNQAVHYAVKTPDCVVYGWQSLKHRALCTDSRLSAAGRGRGRALWGDVLSTHVLRARIIAGFLSSPILFVERVVQLCALVGDVGGKDTVSPAFFHHFQGTSNPIFLQSRISLSRIVKFQVEQKGSR